jgi:hypothetical protein
LNIHMIKLVHLKMLQNESCRESKSNRIPGWLRVELLRWQGDWYHWNMTSHLQSGRTQKTTYISKTDQEGNPVISKVLLRT